MSATPLSITASYAFVEIAKDSLLALRQELIAFGAAHQLQGLVLIAEEGINATVSGSIEGIEEWKNELTRRFGPIVFKDSTAQEEIFRRWSVKIKPEIVALKDPAIKPHGRHRHLTPAEWKEMLRQDDVVVLDARNSYEYAIGKFKGAIDPGTRAFHEFPAAVEKAALPKDKKVLMYCTGGIRCEKALIAMEARGYENVYQLEGGILGYLQQFPHEDFEGECFVFDHRVAVDQSLQPSQTYGLCPHCGEAGSVEIDCFCGNTQKVCPRCAQDPAQQTCSKRCRNDVKHRQPAVR